MQAYRNSERQWDDMIKAIPLGDLTALRSAIQKIPGISLNVVSDGGLPKGVEGFTEWQGHATESGNVTIHMQAKHLTQPQHQHAGFYILAHELLHALHYRTPEIRPHFPHATRQQRVLLEQGKARIERFLQTGGQTNERPPTPEPSSRPGRFISHSTWNANPWRGNKAFAQTVQDAIRPINHPEHLQALKALFISEYLAYTLTNQIAPFSNAAEQEIALGYKEATLLINEKLKQLKTTALPH